MIQRSVRGVYDRIGNIREEGKKMRDLGENVYIEGRWLSENKGSNKCSTIK